MTVEIPLTQGQIALVDDEDVELLGDYRWQASWSRKTKTYYASRANHKNGERGTLAMHRVIMGAKRGQMVDHINHDTLDNRRSNLRFCTNAENVRNGSRHQRNHLKGVYHRAPTHKWAARISLNGKAINLGYFDTEEDAGKAYDRAAIEHFGEFAHLNFPRL